MNLTLNQLKSKWNKEKDYYKSKEIGSGVHSFIRECLKSSELFNLKEGLLSTKLENRKNEFKHEENAKERRIADFVIFIDPDIVIPIETECYENITAGVKQLFSYQKDYEKQYGILTDGHLWRFYNNNIYREFTLNFIFENPDLFLEFWREYIKPEFYYLSFFEPLGQLSLFKENKLSVEQNIEIFFNDITKLITSFNKKLQIEGYFNNLNKREKEKKAVEITYAYLIQFILYKTLVDNNFGNFINEFKDRIENIHNGIKSKSYKEILSTIQGISNQISKNIYRPFSEEQDFISNTVKELFDKPKNKLSDVSPWLDIFIFIKKYYFGNVRNEIFGYVYENYLKELFKETQEGQYFTDPSVVNFMLDQVGYKSNSINKRLNNNPEDEYISLIDPSCGSGTFLYSAVGRILNSFNNDSEFYAKKVEELVNYNIFGLDIEEFPLYLAEMNILMRMLPLIINEKYNNPIDKKIKVFKTRDSIAEFIDTSITNTLFDEQVEITKSQGQLSLFSKKLNLDYESYVRDKNDLLEMKRSLEGQPRCPRKRFDYVIGNPPYISYNNCSKQGILVFNWIKEKIVKLNDIYGVNLHSIPDNPKKYRPNPNLYAFFIALGLALLKDKGKLCYIIPQTILVNPDLDVIRYHLSKFTTINKIIIFSGKLFVGRGLKQKKAIPTSSLIFITSKELPKYSNKIEIIVYKRVGDELKEVFKNIENGIGTKKNTIEQYKLIEFIDNWNFIKLDNNLIEFMKTYVENTEGMENYYEHSISKSKYNDKFIFDGGYSIDEKKILQKQLRDVLNYGIPVLNNKYWTIKEDNGYWPNERDRKKPMFIELRQGSQGYELLDRKYKIIWSYNKTEKFLYTDKPIIWARNKILGIASDNKEEIFYLLAILNSKVTKFLLDNFIKVENEDTRTILVSIQIIKDQIRIPKIDDSNLFIKNEIIKKIEEIIKADKYKLSDAVDFSNVLTQKFNNVFVKGNELVLQSEDNIINLKISLYSDLIGKIIHEKFNKDFLSQNKTLSLYELVNLPIIDYKFQDDLKSYIDDLVFSLYFKIKLDTIGISNAEKIRLKCKQSIFYSLLNI